MPSQITNFRGPDIGVADQPPPREVCFPQHHRARVRPVFTLGGQHRRVIGVPPLERAMPQIDPNLYKY